MYTVLTGAKKNIGDFLITERCKSLLRFHRPEHELFQLPHWEPLDQNLERVNRTAAVIIMGGPGFQAHFYPGVYKLTKNLDDLKVPIIPMGLGWKSTGGDVRTLQNFRFSPASQNTLRKISGEIKYLSCRDYATKTVLEINGIPNALMTGCPVWYDLESIGKEFKKPAEIKRLVFTPAQEPLYQEQSIAILKMLRELFPKTELYCSFHRGITADQFTSKADEAKNLAIKAWAEKLAYRVVDVSYDLNKVSFYDDCDCHVGYRVHAHLYFLSKRKPSFMIHEDNRGIGVAESLNVLGINGFEKTMVGQFNDVIKIPLVTKSFRKLFGVIKANPDTVFLLKQYLIQELENNFARFAGIGRVIDAHYEVMKAFIQSLP